MMQRDVRYQAAVVRDGKLLLIQCASASGRLFWMLPGGGREEGDADEAACVAREVVEETHLSVRVERLLYEIPAFAGDGMYQRLKTYLCTVLEGEAAPGVEPEVEAIHEIHGVGWFDLRDEAAWGDVVRSDPFTYPQMVQIRALLGFGADGNEAWQPSTMMPADTA